MLAQWIPKRDDTAWASRGAQDVPVLELVPRHFVLGVVVALVVVALVALVVAVAIAKTCDRLWFGDEASKRQTKRMKRTERIERLERKRDGQDVPPDCKDRRHRHCWWCLSLRPLPT